MTSQWESLPRDRLWGGPGSGASCAACGRVIEHHEMEYEVECSPSAEGDGQASYRFHVQCFAAWESKATERRRADVDSPSNRRHEF